MKCDGRSCVYLKTCFLPQTAFRETPGDVCATRPPSTGRTAWPCASAGVRAAHALTVGGAWERKGELADTELLPVKPPSLHRPGWRTPLKPLSTRRARGIAHAHTPSHAGPLTMWSERCAQTRHACSPPFLWKCMGARFAATPRSRDCQSPVPEGSKAPAPLVPQIV